MLQGFVAHYSIAIEDLVDMEENGTLMEGCQDVMMDIARPKNQINTLKAPMSDDLSFNTSMRF